MIDLTSLINNLKNKIEYENSELDFSNYITNTSIIRLKDIETKLTFTKLVDDSIQITGYLKGTMFLPDDVTLEEVKYNFDIKIEENLINVQNLLDILPILWENILVEIPSKIRSEKTSDITLKGSGWRLITEEDYEKEKNNNSPFKDLDKMLEQGKER